MNIKEFKALVLSESIGVLFEADEEIASLEELLKSSEEEVKRIKNLIDAENAYLTKIQDVNLKKSSNIKVQEFKKQYAESQANLATIKNSLETKKTAIKNKIEEKPMEITPNQVEEAEIPIQMKPKSKPLPVQAQKKIVKPQPITKPVQVTQPISKPVSKKTYLVKFDQNTEAPYSVSFSQRGFLIGDTRLSFELLEKALSKGFTITLNNGFVLSPIRMQKILKYKDRF